MLAWKLPSRLVYTAVIECEPAVSAFVANVAVPVPLKAWGVPSGEAPSMKWTLPVGMAVLIPAPAVFATVAVKVTDWPRIDGFSDEVTTVEVGAGLTVWL